MLSEYCCIFTDISINLFGYPINVKTAEPNGFMFVKIQIINIFTLIFLDSLLGVFVTSYSMRDLGTAFFLWGLEGPKPNERRFKKRYLSLLKRYLNLFKRYFNLFQGFLNIC